MNRKKTSTKVASLAAQTLSNSNASATAKKLAGSALSQKSTSNQTGSAMEGLASRVVKSSKYGDVTKTLAASVLSQSNVKR